MFLTKNASLWPRRSIPAGVDEPIPSKSWGVPDGETCPLQSWGASDGEIHTPIVVGCSMQGDMSLQVSLSDWENQDSSLLTADLVLEGYSQKGLFFGYHHLICDCYF